MKVAKLYGLELLHRNTFTPQFEAKLNYQNISFAGYQCWLIFLADYYYEKTERLPK